MECIHSGCRELCARVLFQKDFRSVSVCVCSPRPPLPFIKSVLWLYVQCHYFILKQNSSEARLDSLMDSCSCSRTLLNTRATLSSQIYYVIKNDLEKECQTHFRSWDEFVSAKPSVYTESACAMHGLLEFVKYKANFRLQIAYIKKSKMEIYIKQLKNRLLMINWQWLLLYKYIFFNYR